MRITRAILTVMLGTIASGAIGGLAGAAVGHFAPTFVRWFYDPMTRMAPPDFSAVEFGLGLGIVCGLFLGAGVCTLLVVVISLRDAFAYRTGGGPAIKGSGPAREL